MSIQKKTYKTQETLFDKLDLFRIEYTNEQNPFQKHSYMRF